MVSPAPEHDASRRVCAPSVGPALRGFPVNNVSDGLRQLNQRVDIRARCEGIASTGITPSLNKANAG